MNSFHEQTLALLLSLFYPFCFSLSLYLYTIYIHISLSLKAFADKLENCRCSDFFFLFLLRRNRIFHNIAISPVVFKSSREICLKSEDPERIKSTCILHFSFLFSVRFSSSPRLYRVSQSLVEER